MKKLARNVHVRLIAVSCAVVLSLGCSEEVDEIERELLTEWNGVVRRIEQSKATSWESWYRICRKVSDRTGGEQSRRIISKFADMLFSINMSSLGLFEQLSALDVVFDVAYDLARVPPILTDKERWQILLRALAWERSQFLRIARTDRSVFEKRNSKWNAQMQHIVDSNMEDAMLLRFPEEVSVPSNARLQRTLDNISGRLKRHKYVRLNVIRRLATDIEDDRYPDEFREWARAEMENVIGRPLTDDDLMFKDDVLQRREERKRRAHDEEVRKPHDGGNVLPHPFAFLGCTFGSAYDLSKLGGKDTCDDVILCWFKNFRIDPFFGKVWMTLSLAPRSKIAYSAEISWGGQNTREELFALAKDVKADIEKRLGVKLGEFFFEDRSHVCDAATWWKADWGCARSRSVFGPILIELAAADKPGNFSPSRQLSLIITDKAAEALVEKERKENPLTFDSKAEEEAERRRFERLKELSRRRKAMKDAQKKAGGAGSNGN